MALVGQRSRYPFESFLPGSCYCCGVPTHKGRQCLKRLILTSCPACDLPHAYGTAGVCISFDRYKASPTAWHPPADSKSRGSSVARINKKSIANTAAIAATSAIQVETCAKIDALLGDVKAIMAKVCQRFVQKLSMNSAHNISIVGQPHLSCLC